MDRHSADIFLIAKLQRRYSGFWVQTLLSIKLSNKQVNLRVGQNVVLPVFFGRAVTNNQALNIIKVKGYCL